jgi:hypothetical protein
MRLLNVRTRQLEEFIGDRIPAYAILSHTWGEEEVSLQDLKRNDHVRMLGYRKIDGCCLRAIKNGYGYVWIDTCCIDKTSSTELSEAINSMFEWYQNSGICFVFLADVTAEEDPFSEDSSFRKSRWFTRGWTLQELMAPRHIQFADKSWNSICVDDYFNPATQSAILNSHDNRSLIRLLHEITRIDLKSLINFNPQYVSIAQRLSWAAKRRTTREEDIAYCLLGLLGVNMPLLYGEGPKAFLRLQKQIISESNDLSLLTWGLRLSPYIDGHTSALASSLEQFKNCYDVITCQWPYFRDLTHFMMTNNGLSIELHLLEIDGESGTSLAILGCLSSTRRSECIAISLLRVEGSKSMYERLTGPPIFVAEAALRRARRRHIYIVDKYDHWVENPYNNLLHRWGFFPMPMPKRIYYPYQRELVLEIRFEGLSRRNGYDLKEIYPPRILKRSAEERWGLRLVKFGSALWYKDLRRVLLLFTNDSSKHQEQQETSFLLFVEVRKGLLRNSSDFQIRAALSKIPSSTILDHLLSSDWRGSLKISWPRIFQDKALGWKQEITVPSTFHALSRPVNQRISVSVTRDDNKWDVNIKVDS